MNSSKICVGYERWVWADPCYTNKLQWFAHAKLYQQIFIRGANLWQKRPEGGPREVWIDSSVCKLKAYLECLFALPYATNISALCTGIIALVGQSATLSRPL